MTLLRDWKSELQYLNEESDKLFHQTNLSLGCFEWCLISWLFNVLIITCPLSLLLVQTSDTHYGKDLHLLLCTGADPPNSRWTTGNHQMWVSLAVHKMFFSPLSIYSCPTEGSSRWLEHYSGFALMFPLISHDELVWNMSLPGSRIIFVLLRLGFSTVGVAMFCTVVWRAMGLSIFLWYASIIRTCGCKIGWAWSQEHGILESSWNLSQNKASGSQGTSLTQEFLSVGLWQKTDCLQHPSPKRK